MASSGKDSSRSSPRLVAEDVDPGRADGNAVGALVLIPDTGPVVKISKAAAGAALLSWQFGTGVSACIMEMKDDD